MPRVMIPRPRTPHGLRLLALLSEPAMKTSSAISPRFDALSPRPYRSLLGIRKPTGSVPTGNSSDSRSSELLPREPQTPKPNPDRPLPERVGRDAGCGVGSREVRVEQRGATKG